MEKTFVPADILLPSVQYDPSQWACVACDQFTSEPEYWQKAWACAAGQPSTLRLILPEVYLNSDSPQRLQERIESIHEQLDGYPRRPIWQPPIPGCRADGTYRCEWQTEL